MMFRIKVCWNSYQKNSDGFQHELWFRKEKTLPFITGSWSAHDCCAVAAHKARKDKMLQNYKDRHTNESYNYYATSCGRALCLGVDKNGCSYWKFHSDPSLFVCTRNTGGDSLEGNWLRFHEPETVASVIICLGKEEPVCELRRSFPKAVSLLRTGQWAELLQKRRWSLGNDELGVENKTNEESHTTDSLAIGTKHAMTKANKNSVIQQENNENNEGYVSDEPYEEGEDILVESASGKLLWEAVVVAVSKSRSTDKVNSYRVHYKEWSSRFDEWVQPFRVVEPSDNNLLVQEEMLEEVLAKKDAVPKPLEHMSAVGFLNSRNRARGPHTPLPDFGKISSVCERTRPEERELHFLKATLLIIEAALPVGSVDTSSEGAWRPDVALYWRSMVGKAQCAAGLMGSVVLLEHAIKKQWLTAEAEHMLACMPLHWKAVSDASLSSVALRISLLDGGIKYKRIDKG
mmetsp:Transcript_3362/g.4934  ORF Transcript_3362/g.4934 Transcript_3362/m.4934 type:complete len:460 (+) Transcript_3362:3852-5231(+)